MAQKAAAAQAVDYSALRELFRPHIDSFDYFLDEGVEKAVHSIRAAQLSHPKSGEKLRIYFEKVDVLAPSRPGRSAQPIYPQECRELRITYGGELKIEVAFQINDGVVVNETFHFGHIPIMIMSKRCRLRDADQEKLVFHKEEATEMGGYFICDGLERLGRLVVAQKRNYPLGLIRKSHQSQGPGYTDKAVVIRCVRDDQSSVTVRLHYLKSGAARLGFRIKGRAYLLPVGIVLKALINTNDREIFIALTSCYSEKNEGEKGAVSTPLVAERAQIIIDETKELSLLTRSQSLAHLGEAFQPAMEGFESESFETIAEAVLRDYIFVHLGNNHDKFNLIIFMLQKLYALVDQTATPDDADALQNMEVLLPGHVMTVYLKDRLQFWLSRSRRQILDEAAKGNSFGSSSQIRKLLGHSTVLVGRALESMIKVGKLNAQPDIDLPQKEGLTIQAERLNYYRFLSHFRSVHRGAVFSKSRITSVRKLLPESWGFLCPVHTPDGEPCGLLNHLTSNCRISSFYGSDGRVRDFLKIKMAILPVLVEVGMVPMTPNIERAGPPKALHVLLDGCLVGTIATCLVENAVNHLRQLKLLSLPEIPEDLEVGYVPLSFGGAYPGLYLFTNPSRFIRPVKNLSGVSGESQSIELIGPFEQAFMEIKCLDGGDGGRSESFPATHEEIHPTVILSMVANLTPYSDHNQSPRNMYQCQMAKQTMGFSSQALKYRRDVKSYHLQTPQSPIVRTATYSKYCLDEFPTGTNAIVAVLAYTGYDMEDAMILNKSSVERGMCRGHIYETDTIDLSQKSDNRQERHLEIFARSGSQYSSSIDLDGLPYIGQRIYPNEPLYCKYNKLDGRTTSVRLKSSEPAIIDYISVDGTNSKQSIQKVNIRMRRPRNPIIGDKFSSRHGQKGVCSQLWPDIDMPFSANTGMRPDLIINPHAFPSRMTIGMLLESIAAKAGSLKGNFMDATPFPIKDKEGSGDSSSDSIVDELGPLLAKHGFNYHGAEVLYSGVLGTELVCEIFIGPVYYQRLRHMVSDKFQVRSTGRVDKITQQPIGGRKYGGGVRFGEMERDALIAHGAAYLLNDRLHACSDYHIADVCSLCGSILTTTTMQPQKRVHREVLGLPQSRLPKRVMCHACKTSKGMETVAMPYVFRYLAAELAAMNIKLELRLSGQSAK